MSNQSFRDILAGFLDEKETISPLKTGENPAAAPLETPFFTFEMPFSPSKTTGKSFPYPKAKVAAPAPAAKPEPVETKWPVASLSAAERLLVQRLVQLGAGEIANEISVSSLKKAHRRLARRYHPDAGNKNGQENFLAVQSIYEELRERLAARLASEKACGNESASEPASRRPNAA